MEKDNLIYNPPVWMVCDECGGNGSVLSTQASYEGYARDVTCPVCHGTGRIPISYTTEQWQEAGGVLSDDTPVWTEPAENNGWKWQLDIYQRTRNCYINKRGVKRPIYVIIAISGQDRPPADWRSE